MWCDVSFLFRCQIQTRGKSPLRLSTLWCGKPSPLLLSQVASKTRILLQLIFKVETQTNCKTQTWYQVSSSTVSVRALWWGLPELCPPWPRTRGSGPPPGWGWGSSPSLFTPLTPSFTSWWTTPPGTRQALNNAQLSPLIASFLNKARSALLRIISTKLARLQDQPPSHQWDLTSCNFEMFSSFPGNISGECLALRRTEEHSGK